MLSSAAACPAGHRRGFTLIELLVVIVILGILMAVAVPTFLRQQAKAQDSRTQQYLTTAFKAIRSGLPDTNNQYPSSTSMVSWIQQSEPELTAERGDCLTGVTSAPVDAVLVDPSSTSNSLQLCARSQSGNVWKLTASATGVQQLLDGTLVPLTVSGNEITDATRAADVQGDGLSNDSSTGMWEATTNLVTNGGAETDTSSWSASYVPAITDHAGTLARSTEQAKFGAASLKLVCDAKSQGDALNGFPWSAGTYSVSFWVYPLQNGTIRTGSNGFGANFAVTANKWQYISYTHTYSGSDSTFAVMWWSTVTGTATFYLDGVQVEQKPLATPYVETDGSTASRGAARVSAPGTLVNATQGWVAFRTRLGWDSSSPPNSAPTFFELFGSSGTTLAVDYESGQLSLFRYPPDFVQVAGSFSAGDEQTVVAAWTASGLSISVDGAAFTTAAASSPTDTFPGPFFIGSSGTAFSDSRPSDSTVLWFACGTGTLTSADATMINGWGDTDPTRASFPSAAQATMVWNGVGSTGSLK